MNPITAATISPIPTLKDFEASGGKPEEYNAFVEARTKELDAEALEAAKGKAKRTIRVRVVGTGWRLGQSHYQVLAKAPWDPRLQPGQEGYEASYKHEPRLSLPIGKVSEVPVRDERHFAMLKQDVNLQIVDDAEPTHQEEKELFDAALLQARSGKRPVAAAVPQAALPTPARPPPPPDIFKVSAAEAEEMVNRTSDISELAEWHLEAERKGNKALAQLVLGQLVDLHERLSRLLDQLMPPKPPAPKGETPATGKPEATGGTTPAAGAATTGPGAPAQGELITPPASGQGQAPGQPPKGETPATGKPEATGGGGRGRGGRN